MRQVVNVSSSLRDQLVKAGLATSKQAKKAENQSRAEQLKRHKAKKKGSPPVTDGSLSGITRDSILEIADELGVEHEEKHLGLFDLLGADEVFITGSGARVVGIATLDGQQIGNLQRPVMQTLVAGFEDYTVRNGTAF